MLHNYLTSALRNLWKHKGYSLINMLGLAVAVASCLLLLFVVQVEKSFDSFHPDVDRIHKVIRGTRMSKTETEYSFGTLGPVGPALEETFPEVEQAIRVLPYWGSLQHGETSFGGNITVVDPEFFDMFGFEVIVGSPEAVFGEPFGLFITERTARKYFGDEDPLGKVFMMDWFEGQYVVRGIIRDPPRSQIWFDGITASLPREPWVDGNWAQWRPLTNGRPVETYVRLREGTDSKILEEKTSLIVEANMGTKWVEQISYRLMPMRDVWLYAHQEFGIDWYSDVSLLYAIGFIAASILIIACFNYINLATARSQSRGLEVGLRKVVGAHRRQLAGQFFGESVVVVVLATIVGLVMARLFLPTFNSLIEKNVPFDIANVPVAVGFLTVVAVVTLLSGLYPAVVLSSFQPSAVLKGSMSRTRRGIWLRRGLVIGQFGISISLGVGLLVMDNQMAYVQTKDLGFSRRNILHIRYPLETIPDSLRTPELREEVRKAYGDHPSILASTRSRRAPGLRNTSNVIWIPEGSEQTKIRTPMMAFDEGFLDTYQIRLVAGRNFSEAFESDNREAFILTEAAVKRFGWDNESAIGKEIECPVREKQDGRPRGRVIGWLRIST